MHAIETFAIIYVRMYVCMYVCTYVCMYLCVYTFMCIHMCECEAWSFVDIRVREKERKIAREWKAARASEKERNRDAKLKDTVMMVPSCISLFCSQNNSMQS